MVMTVDKFCVRFLDRNLKKRCGKPMTKRDTHDRPLCDDCFDAWQGKRKMNAENLKRYGTIGHHDIQSLENLVKMLEDNSGTVDDLARELNGCRRLLSKLRGKPNGKTVRP